MIYLVSLKKSWNLLHLISKLNRNYRQFFHYLSCVLFYTSYKEKTANEMTIADNLFL